MDCEFRSGVCVRCGFRLPDGIGDSARKNCKGPPGWGDRLAAWLTGWGITKCAYLQWKVRWGFAGNCNCEKRRAKLNGVGRRVVDYRKRLAKWLVRD